MITSTGLSEVLTFPTSILMVLLQTFVTINCF